MAGLVNSAGESPLYLAAESRCKEVLLKILKFLTQVSYNPTLLREAVRGPDRQNPLHAAILSGSSECIGHLLGLEEILELINQPDRNRMTALHFATAARETKLIRQLLNESTLSAYIKDTKGWTPLLEAASSGNFDVFQEIFQHCPDTIELCDPAGWNALHLAVLNNTVQNARDFLGLPEMKELVNEPDKEGNTPLHLAIENIKSSKLESEEQEGPQALDICESDWKLSYRQKSLYSYLNGQHAPRGRHPYNWKLSPKRKSVFNHPGSDLKHLANTLTMVAALLVTLTFAAAFTLPDDYYSDNGSQGKNNDDQKDYTGESVLIKKASLKVFLVADSLAMCCSMTVVTLLVLAMVGDPAFLHSAIIYSKNLLYIALGGTLFAFVTGLFSVIDSESRWVAIVLIVMCSSVPFLIKYLCRKSSIRPLLLIS
ncbi:hypothetical protein Pint_04261 [Pistacia integerrima]|uniref:Uncharacterized protein n=1 Tax=Pistacia integerrima TaxID=434235 RepID=A0ACC0Z5S4_9ROSI|nr:hypothetical protein Pint_04261 [Pistacia integerrima]